MGARRASVTRWIVVACLGVLLVGCGTGPGDDDEIAVGFLGELTGNFSVWGVPARNGMQLAVDEVNAAGGIDGRDLVLVERDTRGLPEEAVTALRGLVDRSGVVAVGGIISSDVGLSAARVAEEEQVPLFLVKAGSERILTTASRYTFRTCLPAAPANVAPLAAFVAAEGFTRIGAIVADYAWGQSIRDAIEAQLDVPGIELQIEVAPVSESDFTPILRRLDALDPQLIIATGHPPGSSAITRQAAELGFDALVTGPYAAAATVRDSVGELAFDRYVDLSCADVSSGDFAELAGRYHARFDAYMENDAVAGYGQVLMVAEAIRETGSADPVDIAAYLRGTRFDLPGYAFPVGFTPWGELAEARPLVTILRRQPPPSGVNPGADWYPEVVLRPDAIEPFEPAES